MFAVDAPGLQIMSALIRRCTFCAFSDQSVHYLFLHNAVFADEVAYTCELDYGIYRLRLFCLSVCLSPIKFV